MRGIRPCVTCRFMLCGCPLRHVPCKGLHLAPDVCAYITLLSDGDLLAGLGRPTPNKSDKRTSTWDDEDNNLNFGPHTPLGTVVSAHSALSTFLARIP